MRCGEIAPLQNKIEGNQALGRGGVLQQHPPIAVIEKLRSCVEHIR
jgi:hypothetical protein